MEERGYFLGESIGSIFAPGPSSAVHLACFLHPSFACPSTAAKNTWKTWKVVNNAGVRRQYVCNSRSSTARSHSRLRQPRLLPWTSGLLTRITCVAPTHYSGTRPSMLDFLLNHYAPSPGVTLDTHSEGSPADGGPKHQRTYTVVDEPFSATGTYPTRRSTTISLDSRSWLDSPSLRALKESARWMMEVGYFAVIEGKMSDWKKNLGGATLQLVVHIIKRKTNTLPSPVARIRAVRWNVALTRQWRAIHCNWWMITALDAGLHQLFSRWASQGMRPRALMTRAEVQTKPAWTWPRALIDPWTEA